MRVVLFIAAVLLLAGAAGAADGDPTLKSCYSTAPAPPCVGLSPTFQGGDVEVSPDGRHLYAAVWRLDSSGWTGIRLFDVSPDGSITPRAGAEGCYTNATPGCTATSAEFSGTDVDLSPDGKNLYLAGGSNLVVFNRNTTSGALVQAQCLGLGCVTPIMGLGSNVDSVAVSPDSTNVYGRGGSQVYVFDRNPADGQLTQKLGLAGCFADEDLVAPPCTLADGIAGSGYESVVSPDGRQLYVANNQPGGVAIFNRAPDGTLAAAGCITSDGTSGSPSGPECTDGEATLGSANAVNLDAQGQFLFTSAGAGQTVFRRNADGTLNQTDCLDEAGGSPPLGGCREVKGAGGYDAAVTPDGNNVVLNAKDFGLSFFTLDRASGQLSQRAVGACFSDTGPAPPCEHVPGLLHGAGGVAIAPNGLDVFSTIRLEPALGGSIASFERDAAPGCENKTITAQRDKSVVVPLTCTDANGDQITLEVTTPPGAGTLGPIDQTNDRVLYTPDPNYTGKDSFKYRGTARGAASSAATVALTVAGKPVARDRTPPNTRISGGPPNRTKSGKARLKFRSTERGSLFQCKLDRRPWTGCRSPKRFKGLKLGKHTFRVRAIDRAGNVDRTPAKRIWTRTKAR